MAQTQQVQLQAQLQTQFRHQQQLPQPSYGYVASGVRGQQDAEELGYTQLPVAANSISDPTRFQGLPVAQDWMLKNKPAGT